MRKILEIDEWLDKVEKSEDWIQLMDAHQNNWQNAKKFEALFSAFGYTYSLLFVKNSEGSYELSEFEEITDEHQHCWLWN